MERFFRAILIGMSCFAILIANTIRADDTELYVLDFNTQAGVQPRVMIIFDNSGSMSSKVYSKDPFVPTSSYTRIYWSTNGQVPSSNSSNYFNASANNCNASISALSNVGSFTDVIRQWRSSSWRTLSNNNRNSVVDCKTDVDNLDTANPGSGATGFPALNQYGPYTTNTARKSTSFTTPTVTLYSGAYVNWYNSAPTLEGTRLQVAKDTVNNLITSSPNVDYGLATFNMNNNASNTPGTDDGGRIVYASKNANDTADTSDTNAQYRQALVNTVNSLTALTWTPLSESFYEVSHYWQGGNVWKGKWSGNPQYDPTAMLSGLTQYKTPFDSCHNHGYIILITDGAPTHDTAANSLIQNEYINGLNQAELTTWGKSFSYKEDDNTKTSYLPSLAGYLKHKDLNTGLDGDQTVTTYTIGFGDDAMANAQDLLEAAATQGGGKYYAALNADELGQALQNIIIDILNQQYSILAPATATSTSDRSQYLDNLYYSLFIPNDGPGWIGNLKKLKFSNELGYIVDQNNNPAITATGKIVNNAQTFWSSEKDGDSISKGGVQDMLSQKENRKIYTNNGNSFSILNKTNLLSIATSEDQLVDDLGVTSVDDIDEQINWILGKDVDGTNATLNLVNRETVLSDMMHSKPLVINYGILTGTKPELRIITGSNAGFLHMFRDADTSVDESWAFIPYKLLLNQATLRADTASSSHMYGLDGSAVSYIEDKNNDSKIKASDNDIAWIFLGQRQGGRSYYAVNITTPDTPSLKWIITGGTTTGFTRLGDTWSVPQITKVPGYEYPVVIFGGGYDVNKDASGIGAADEVGNAIYIVDADTGGSNFKFVISPDTCATSSACLRNTAMTDSIPASVSLMDSDGDNITDRIYAAYTGGNIWRVDMVGTDRSKWSVFKFASLGSDSVADNDRRFFGAPMVVRSINKKITANADSTYSYTELPFDGVFIGSGNRNKPASDKVVDNGYFMLRDYQINPYPIGSTKPNPFIVTDLYDISDNPLGSASTESAQLEIQADLTSAKGWVYWMDGSGEKVFGSGSVVNGVLYFSSFLPEISQNLDVCSMGNSIGTTRFYSLNMHYGTYTGTNAYESVDDLLIENLSTYVGDDKKIRLLGGPGDIDGTVVTGTTETTGTTLPKKAYDYMHEK